jgi:ABC-2 type transport system permease protein
VAELVALARIYRRLIGARIRSDLQYRTSFVLFTSSQFLITFLDFVTIFVLFQQVPTLDGWTVEEVAFLYGVSGVAFGLADVFVSQVDDLSTRIRDGSFDRLLIRPLGTLFQIVTDDFALRRFGKVGQAALVLVVALGRIDVDWTAGRVVMVPLMVVSGALIFGSVWVAGCSLVFWATEGREVVNAFTYGGNFLTQYPLNIYAQWLRRLFAIAVPLAFVNYFPALYVLGRDDDLGAPAVVQFLSPAVAVVTVLTARAVWQTGVRHYRSTGS